MNDDARSPLFRVMLVLLGAVLVLGLAACGDDRADDNTDAGAQPTESAEEGGELTVTAIEYEFDIPETVPAGETTLMLQNDGEEPHFIAMYELKEDAPELSELLQQSQKEAQASFVREVVETDVANPGDSVEADEAIDLTPGRYAYVCFVESPDGQPHAFLGMSGEFTVE